MIISGGAEKVLNINFRANLNHTLHDKTSFFLNHAVYKILTINKAESEGLRQEYKNAVTVFSTITLHLINSV
jgi:hypothetical protein